ncbi:hypothetical protein LRAMOSA09304 [Lichtheimia ramosa]|uniref:Uncharacterized protein n=1 Tax=Lichtheimia ramosa TaxID=688394 RepID=A0A077WHY4_9FUNG|nr:hypothetical protein LRAMOSA09304 [Lichtheimia ramosa]
MQQMTIKLGTVSKAVLQQTSGKAGKVVSHDKLHFSVCSIHGEWSGEDLAGLVEDAKWIMQQPLPSSIHDDFMCEEEAFLNTDDRRQVLGICPNSKTSTIHTLIGMH